MHRIKSFVSALTAAAIVAAMAPAPAFADPQLYGGRHDNDRHDRDHRGYHRDRDHHDRGHHDRRDNDHNRRNGDYYYHRQWSNADRNYNRHNRRDYNWTNSRHYDHDFINEWGVRDNYRYYSSRHPGARYHVGGRYHRHQRTIIINDYNRYGLRRPPHGHHWVRDHDSGDAILTSVATGAIIGLVVGIIANDLNDDHHHHRRPRRW